VKTTKREIQLSTHGLIDKPTIVFFFEQKPTIVKQTYSRLKKIPIFKSLNNFG